MRAVYDILIFSDKETRVDKLYFNEKWAEARVRRLQEKGLDARKLKRKITVRSRPVNQD